MTNFLTIARISKFKIFYDSMVKELFYREKKTPQDFSDLQVNISPSSVQRNKMRSFLFFQIWL